MNEVRVTLGLGLAEINDVRIQCQSYNMISMFIHNFLFLSSTELFHLSRLISRYYGFIEHTYNVSDTISQYKVTTRKAKAKEDFFVDIL